MPLVLSGCHWMALVGEADRLDGAMVATTMSADGRSVAFEARYAPDPEQRYVAVRDLATGAEVYLGGGAEPSMDADGHLVAYTQWVFPESTQIHIYNRRNGTTVLVSANLLGVKGNGWSATPSLDGYGHNVAFSSSSSDLVVGDTNGMYDVFVRDNLTRTTSRVSVNTTGGDPDGRSGSPAMSGNGRYTAFDSVATNLVTGDANGVDDIFVRDHDTDVTIRASVGAAGQDPDGPSIGPSSSGDGRLVVFQSTATNLVPGDTNGVSDVFVRDLQAGTTTRVSVDSSGGQVNGPSTEAMISDDGRFVAMRSSASGLVPGDTNGLADVFVRDLQAGSTTRVSLDPLYGQANGTSWSPSLSGNGALVSFATKATNLAEADPMSGDLAFVRAVLAPTLTAVTPSTAARGTDVTVTLQGTGFAPESTLLVVGDGVVVNSVTYVSPTELQVSVSVAPDADVGPRSLLVMTPGPGPGLLPGSYGPCVHCLAVT